MNKEKIHFDYVTGKLGISPVQAVLFSHFMERSDDNRIMASEIAASLKCSTIRILKYLNECDELEKKKLIRCSRDSSGIRFRVPHDVRNSLRKYNEFRQEKKENLSNTRFFAALKKLFKERENSELSSPILYIELKDLINLNMHLEFCKKIISYKLDWSDFVLLICFCLLAENNNHIGADDLEFLDDGPDDLDGFDFSINKIELELGSHLLMERNYVEFANSGGFIDSEHWKLSDRAKNELLAELKTKDKFRKNMILSNKIQNKKMFYNTREMAEIEKISSLLQEDNFKMIQDRLDAKGMRKGFACLFSGSPGTGKTETVYQIARETKRNIMMVDISAIKSCWYGESEKTIKEVFDNYRYIVENSKIIPILLFNEADAIIGKRRVNNGDNRNSTVDQTENTIQNIILQEMENFNGILIATSNLIQNMDNAFERRFLYKIRFEKPKPETRVSIWTSLFPDVPKNQIAVLANQFELSGGQIENIARKIEVDWITEGKTPTIDALLQYCKDEVQNDFNTSKRIGFAND
jgi:hypothetical protein